MLAAMAIQMAKDQALIAVGLMHFKDAVVPDNIPPDQMTLMEIAFFAGAQHLMACLLAVSKVRPGPTERVALLQGVAKEMDRFTNDYYMQHVRQQPGFTQH